MAGTPVVAIVDPYDSGSRYVPLLRERGYGCLGLQSSPTRPSGYRMDLDGRGFAGTVPYARELSGIIAQLAGWDLRCVLAGEETGVNLADRLSEALGLYSNGSALTVARRHKFAMARRAADWGLRTPAQHCCDDLAGILAWVRDHGRWPVVLKPPLSSSNDGVFRCFSQGEVTRAFAAIMGRRNRLGLINDAVIVQELVAGTEYIVDTVSHDGRHRVAAIWRYRQPGSRHFGYDAIELLPATGDTQEALAEFTRRVLDALGIRYGPAHCELMWAGDAPVLIEIGARAHGGISPGVSRRCGGRGQLELTLDAYLDPGRFLRSAQAPYPLDKRALIVFLIPGMRGVLKGLGSLSPLRRLPSFADASIWVRPGQPVHRAVGRVILIHSDREVLEGDLEHIRALMRNGLCEMELPGEDEC